MGVFQYKGSSTLDGAYDGGNTITVDGDAVTLTVPNTSNNVGLSVVQQDTTNNPDAVTIENDGTGDALFLNQDGNGMALNIDTAATSQPGIFLSGASSPEMVIRDTTNTVDLRFACGDTIGLIGTQSNHDLRIRTNDTDAIYIKTDGDVGIGALNPSAKLEVEQASAQVAVLIDQNAAALSLQIDSESASTHALEITHAGDGTTAAKAALSVIAESGAGAAHFYRNENAATTIGALVMIEEDSTSDQCPLLVQNDGTADGILVDQNGNAEAIRIDSEADTAHCFQIDIPATTTGSCIRINSANSLTSGSLIYGSSSSSSATTRRLLRIDQTDTLATGAITASFRQDAPKEIVELDHNSTSAGCSYINFLGTAAANSTNPISTLTTSGATTHHIQIEINGVKAWIAASTNNPS